MLWIRAWGLEAFVMSGQKNKGKVCAKREDVSGIRLASEINFEVNAILANTDLFQTHGIFIEVLIMNTQRSE